MGEIEFGMLLIKRGEENLTDRKAAKRGEVVD